MATIYEVSKLAGVSLATVSRVINGNDNVRAKTKEKVFNAIKELDYRPNSVAKSLASSRSNSVGVMIDELHGPIFGSMMSQIETKLRNEGKHVVFTAGHSKAETEREGIEFLISRNCDALILHIEALTNEELILLSKKTNAPFIFINRYIPELATQCLYMNNIHGGYMASKALTDHGHKEIAYISGPDWKVDAIDRLNGHKKALDEAGVLYNDELVFVGDYHEDSGYHGMKKLLSSGQPITAVACGNDEMAAGAMRAIREAGKSIPEDISCVGYDNIIFSRFMNPRLTTIHYPIDEMGMQAAEMVMQLCYSTAEEDKNASTDVNGDQDAHHFIPKLIERESIATLN